MYRKLPTGFLLRPHVVVTFTPGVFTLNEQRSITGDTALRLAKYVGTTPEFWMNLQTAYDVKRAILESGSMINRTVKTRAA